MNHVIILLTDCVEMEENMSINCDSSPIRFNN